MNKTDINNKINKIIEYKPLMVIKVFFITIKSRIFYEISNLYINQGVKELKELKKLNLRNKLENEKQTNYLLPLIPLDNAVNTKLYQELIKESLENNQITNIAITGYYGSGKSSILKTFIKNYPKYNYLNLSLAHFESNKDIQLNDIESNILQQIFYKETSSNIPNSRFKRINKNTFWSLFFYSIVFVLFFLLSGVVLNIEVIKNAIPELILNIYINTFPIQIMQFISFICFILFSSFLITRLIRILNISNLSKVNLKSGEIEVGNSIESSIMNKHIDEILYLFEARKYEVVIIEDLDRFEKNNIFSKLRELNTLLNNSDQINQKVVFIYAVKDDLFSNNLSRVKFFDIIIPVIPFINSTNSYDILLRELNKEKFGDLPNDNFIKDISIYITDKRILNNIINEYFVYKTQIAVKKQESLFSIIVYKNIFPEDFSRLEFGTSIINLIFKEIESQIENEINSIDSKIELIENEIQIISNEYLYSIEEIRRVYVSILFDKIPNIYSVFLGEDEKLIKDMHLENNFDLLFKFNIEKYKIVDQNGKLATKFDEISIKSILDEVVNGKKYKDRYIAIVNKTNNKQNDLEQEINNLSKLKSDLQTIEFEDFLKKDNFYRIIDKIVNENKKARDKNEHSFSEFERKLLGFLVINGYIDRHFNDYISNHHEESLTKSDRDFVLNVRSRYKNDFNYKLFNPRNIIRELDDRGFITGDILNFDLLDFLLENDALYQKEIELFIFNLSKSISFRFQIAGYDFKFVKEYLRHSESNLEKLFFYINKYFPEFIGLVFDGDFGQEPSWFEEKVMYHTINSIPIYFNYEEEEPETLDSKIVQLLDEKSKLSIIIPEFYNFIGVFKYNSKVREILKEYKVRFKGLVFNKENTELYEYVYSNCYFDINESNIVQYLEYKGFDTKDIYNQNYSTILKSNNKEFINFIEFNINIYLTRVVFKKEFEINDEYDDIIRLINNVNKDKDKEQNLKINYYKQLLEKLIYQIRDLKDVKKEEFHDALFEKNKVIANWKNVSEYLYQYNWELNDIIIGYLNNKLNYESIAKSDFNLTKIDNKFNENLANAIFYCKDLSLDSFNVLIESINYDTDSFDFKELSEDKIIALSLSKIIRLNKNTYNFLKANHPYNHHQFLIKKYTENDSIEDFNIDETDFKQLLSISNLNYALLKDLVEKFASTYILNNQSVALSVSKVISTLEELKIELEVIYYLISNSVSFDIALRYILKYQHKMNRVQLTLAFSKISSTPYIYFTEEGKQFSIPNNFQNAELVKILEERNYITKPKLKGSSFSVYVKKWS